MTAAHAEYHDWESAPALKLLLPQRDEQFRRSAAAINNRVVVPIGKPLFPRGLPSPNPNSKSAGQPLSSSEDKR